METAFERNIYDGVQKIYRFHNGYGASVVRHNGSYGGEDGLWELAVLTFNSDEPTDFNLCYDTPITNDVIGRLTWEEAERELKKIKKLKALED